MKTQDSAMYIKTSQELEKAFEAYWISPKGWNSSALQLDDDIKAAGFNIPLKFYNKYALPDTPNNIERRSYQMWLFTNWSDVIKNIQKTTERIFVLTPELEQELIANKNIIAEQVAAFANLIKNNNPTLQHIETPKTMDQIHFIRGAVYGYPPENIQFWIENYQNPPDVDNISFKYKKILSDKFGIKAGLLRFTEQQGAALVSQLTAQKQAAFAKGIQQVPEKINQPDRFGRLDNTGFLTFLDERGWDD